MKRKIVDLYTSKYERRKCQVCGREKTFGDPLCDGCIMDWFDFPGPWEEFIDVIHDIRYSQCTVDEWMAVQPKREGKEA